MGNKSLKYVLHVVLSRNQVRHARLKVRKDVKAIFHFGHGF